VIHGTKEVSSSGFRYSLLMRPVIQPPSLSHAGMFAPPPPLADRRLPFAQPPAPCGFFLFFFNDPFSSRRVTSSLLVFVSPMSRLTAPAAFYPNVSPHDTFPGSDYPPFCPSTVWHKPSRYLWFLAPRFQLETGGPSAFSEFHRRSPTETTFFSVITPSLTLQCC